MSTADFTDEERTEIARYLGYADWQSMASSVGLGYPSATQPAFQMIDAQYRITPTARAMVRRDLDELRCIEQQLSQARQRFAATELEGMKINPNEAAQLRSEKEHWTRQLADDLGCPINPYRSATGGGGVNARVGG